MRMIGVDFIEKEETAAKKEEKEKEREREREQRGNTHISTKSNKRSKECGERRRSREEEKQREKETDCVLTCPRVCAAALALSVALCSLVRFSCVVCVCVAIPNRSPLCRFFSSATDDFACGVCVRGKRGRERERKGEREQHHLIKKMKRRENKRTKWTFSKKQEEERAKQGWIEREREETKREKERVTENLLTPCRVLPNRCFLRSFFSGSEKVPNLHAEREREKERERERERKRKVGFVM